MSVEISWWVIRCLSTVFAYISKQNIHWAYILPFVSLWNVVNTIKHFCAVIKHFVFDYSPDKQKNARLSRSFFCGSRSDCSRYFTAMKMYMYELSQITATLYTKKVLHN